MTGKNLVGSMPPVETFFERVGINLPVPAPTPLTVHLGTVKFLPPDFDNGELPPLPQSLMEAFKRIEQVSAVFEAQGETPDRGRAVISFKSFFHGSGYCVDKQGHPVNRDINGYFRYLEGKSDAYITALGSVELAPLYDKVREGHTYVTGSSGSGKTELLKVLVHHDLTHGNAAIIIDPQGNFARAVAEWPEFADEGKDRLVYVNPSIVDGFAPALNPLDASGLSTKGKEALSKSLTDVLSQVGGRGDWSSQAETIADNCFKVLVHKDGATLRDLRMAMLEVDKRAELPATVREMRDAGLKHYNREVRDFFEYDFLSGQFSTSRNSLRSKIGALLRDDLFTAITCQPSKISLERLIDDKKIIIFDLGAWGDSRSAGAFGRMVLAQVSALGTRRSMEYGGAKTAVHVYVDEADLFVSPSLLFILSKLRQQGIHLTLAQQTPAYGYTGQDRHQLLNNTTIKFAAGDGQGEMLKMMNAPTDAAIRLTRGQFIGRWGRGEPFKLTVKEDFVNRSMTANQWADVLAHQIETYYAPLVPGGDMLELENAVTAELAQSLAAEQASPAERMMQTPEESEWRE